MGAVKNLLDVYGSKYLEAPKTEQPTSDQQLKNLQAKEVRIRLTDILLQARKNNLVISMKGGSYKVYRLVGERVHYLGGRRDVSDLCRYLTLLMPPV